jgi:hypothetical protein
MSSSPGIQASTGTSVRAGWAACGAGAGAVGAAASVDLAEWDVSAAALRRSGMVGPLVGVGARPDTVRPAFRSPGGRSPLKLMGPRLSGVVLRNPPRPPLLGAVKGLRLLPPWPVPTPVGVPPPSRLGEGRTGAGAAGAAAGAGAAGAVRPNGFGGRGVGGRGRPSTGAGPDPIASWGDGVRTGLGVGASSESLSVVAIRTASARVAWRA